MYFTELQVDALKEVINMGVGYAAGALNDLVGSPISLHVPELEILELDEAQAHASTFGWGRVASVQLGFSGPLKGDVALVFPCDSAVKLVSLLTGDDGSNSDVDGMRAATLEETGNIILNGVVGSIANLLNEQISFSIPYYSEQGGLNTRLATIAKSPGVCVIVARARFGIAEHEIEGEVFIFFEPDSLERLIAALDSCIELPAEV